MKKNKNKKDIDIIADYFNDLESSILYLLNYENSINYKKLNNENLTCDEYFFDNYMIKPSSLLRIIFRRIDKKK